VASESPFFKGFLVRWHDLTSPLARLVEELLTRAEGFLRMGLRNNVAPGMA
jgi:hypothetical protein